MLNNKIFISDEKEFFVKYLYKADNYFTFNIKIKSRDFSGSSNFCISKENIILITESLTKMYNTLTGSCDLKDNDSDSHIYIEMHKFGQIYVSGQIGGSHEDHYMKFKYVLDQTILPNLINIFKILI